MGESKSVAKRLSVQKGEYVGVGEFPASMRVFTPDGRELFSHQDVIDELNSLYRETLSQEERLENLHGS